MKREFTLKGLLLTVVQVSYHLNHKGLNRFLYSLGLISAHFLILLSLLLPNDLDIEAMKLQDKGVFYVIKFANIRNILTALGIPNWGLVIAIICVEAFVILGYALLVLFWEWRKEYIFLKLLKMGIQTFQEAFIWIFYVPIYDLLFETIFSLDENTGIIVVAIFALLFPIGYAIIIKYSSYDPKIMPNNQIVIKIGNIMYYLIFGEILVCLILKALAHVDNLSLGIVFLLLLSAVYVRSYLIDLPIQNTKLSKWFGMNILFFIYATIFVEIKLFSDSKLTIFYFMLFGFIVIAKFFLTLYNNIKWGIYMAQDYTTLSPQRLDFLCRKIVEQLKSTVEKKGKSSYKLLIFLRSHIQTCDDENCKCKTFNFTEIEVSQAKLVDKSVFLAAYKQISVTILSQIISKKLDSMAREDRVDLSIMHGCLLLYHTTNYMKGFIDLTNLRQGRYNLGVNQLFFLNEIQEELERVINKQSNQTSAVKLKFVDIVEFFAVLDSLKKKMFTNIQNYHEFFEELKMSMIDLDKLVQYGLKVGKVNTQILLDLNNLYQINRNNTELRRVLELYDELGIIDEDYLQKLDLYVSTQIRSNIYHASDSDKFPDIFDEEACILFIGLSENKLGALRKATPNIKRLFGYGVEELAFLNIRQLMPAAFAEKHDSFLKHFLARSDYKRLNKFLQVYAMSRDEYIFPISLYLKLEAIEGELLVAGHIKEVGLQKHHMILNDKGFLVAYSQRFNPYIAYGKASNKDFSGIHIGLLMPRILPIFCNALKMIRSQVYKTYSDDIFGMLKSEKVNFVTTNKLEILHQANAKLRNLHNETFGNTRTADIEQFTAQVISDYYNRIKKEDLVMYTIRLNLAMNPQRGDIVKLWYLEIEKIEKVKSAVKIDSQIDHINKFLTNVKPYLTDHPPEIRANSEKFAQQPSRISENDSFPSRTTYVETKNLDDRGMTMEAPAQDSDELPGAKKEESNFERNTINRNQTLFDKKQIAPPVKAIGSKVSFEPDDNMEPINEKDNEESNLLNQDDEGNLDDKSESDLNITNRYKTLNLKSGHIKKVLTDIKHDNEISNLMLDSTMKNTTTGQLLNALVNKSNTLLLEPPQNIMRGSNQFGTVISTTNEEADFINDERDESDGISDNSREVNIDNSDQKRRHIKFADADAVMNINARGKGKGGGNHEASIGSTSSQKSSSSAKYFRSILSTEEAPKEIDRVSFFGLIAMVIFFGLIIGNFLVIFPTLKKYQKFTDFGDFTLQLLSEMAYFLVELEAVNHLQILYIPYTYPQTRIDSIFAKSKIVRESTYETYKQSYLNDVLNQNPEAMSDKFSYEAYNFNVNQLLDDQTSQAYTLEFTFAISKLIETMNEIQYLTPNNFSLTDRNVFYIRSNFPEYFNKLYDSGISLIADITDSDQSSYLEKITIVMLIISLTMNLIFFVLLVPLFKAIDKIKERGLSLLTTIPIKDLDFKIFQMNISKRLIEHILDNEEIQNKIRSTHFYAKKDAEEHAKSRRHRAWKRRQNALLYLCITLLIAFSIITVYFAVNAYRAIYHSQNFVPIYRSFTYASRAAVGVPSFYEFAYESISHVNMTQAQSDAYYAIRSPIFAKIAKAEYDLRNFFDDIESFLTNGDVDSTYASQLRALKENNWCDFIYSVQLNLSQISECKQAFRGVTSLGLTPTVNQTLKYMEQFMSNLRATNYDIATDLSLVSQDEFLGVDTLRYYLLLGFRDYIAAARSSMKSTLDSQVVESIILLVVGLVIIWMEFFFGWRNFIKKLIFDFTTVKRTYAILPIDLIIMNNYIKKFLRDNTASSL